MFFLAWSPLDDAAVPVLAVAAAFVVGVAEEAYQWYLPARVGELKDVWLNGIAIVRGVIASAGLMPSVRVTRWSPSVTCPAARSLAIVGMALAAFVHLVHLGQYVRDGQVSFLSRYSAAELARLSENRREQWRARPPVVRPARLSQEDQFMTEGLQHVQARNRALSAGDLTSAWYENEILETHFAIVLDTPSYVAANGHRWPPLLRGEAEAKVRNGSQTAFVSTAFPYPIYTWSPLTLWVVVLPSSVGMWRLGGSGP